MEGVTILVMSKSEIIWALIAVNLGFCLFGAVCLGAVLVGIAIKKKLAK